MLTSNQMYKTWSTGCDSQKVRAVVTGSTDAAGAIYYWKPKTKCKLIGAELTLLTNTGEGTTVTISRTNIQDNNLIRGKIQISTDITATDINSSDLWIYTLPTTALTTTEFEPQSAIADLFLTVNPDADDNDVEVTDELTTYGNAVKILLADLGSEVAMTGVLTLEYQNIL